MSGLTRTVLRARIGSQLRFDGEQNIPTSGPLVLVCNHLSNIDPFLFGGFTPGTLFCMAKRELFTNSFLRWVLLGCNCFPINRGAPDRWALRTSLEILARGGRLLVFVEGTRATTPGMKRVEAGVGFLVRRSRASVLPIAVWGTEQALPHGRVIPRRVPITVRYGKPFTPHVQALQRPDDQALSDEIARAIAVLLPPPYRGVYA